MINSGGRISCRLLRTTRFRKERSVGPLGLTEAHKEGTMIAQFRLIRAVPMVLAAALAPALLGPAAAQGYGYGNPPAYTPPATPPATAQSYKQVNLVSDQAGVALKTDPNLVNPWGISFGANTPFWVSDNGKGVSTLYQESGDTVLSGAAPLVVRIPAPAGATGAAAPTGTVFNGTTGFALAAGKPALFLFATEDGTLSGWSPGVDMTHAVLKMDNSAKAVYKGLALMGNQLFAANFRGNSVDVFNSDFSPAGSFTDSTVPAGFAPFNIQAIGNTLYVAYAMQDSKKHDDIPGLGHGYIDTFDPATHKFTRLISGGKASSPLSSPWGLAMAPANFGPLSGKLLVANFGDGWINAFDPQTGAFSGSLSGSDGKPIAIAGLWAITFGNSANGQAQPSLFFTAGSGGEQHGLFGRLDLAN
jgi:uncharacterized protein (TIGR03118 family)